MIIYISSKENKDLLNGMAERHEWELLTEEMDKGSLNAFITEKLQVISNLQYMVIERSCIKENEQQLNDVMDTIRAIWDTKFILLEELLQNDEGEQQKVIYSDNITSLYKYQDNLESNLEYLLKGEKIPAEDVYNGTWIGIMSANSGAGATHVAIDLATFIANLGESVCYVEANESGDLGAMAEFYEFEQIEENHYRKDNIDYWHQIVDPEKKFAILDIGKYSAAKMEIFNQCKIKILVTDGKPYRMADAFNVLHYIKDESTRLWLNYTQEEEFTRLHEKYLTELQNPVGRLSWHKSMFQGADILYQDAMKGYLNVNVGKQSKLAYILNPDKLKGMLRTTKPEKKIIEKDAPKLQSEVTEIGMEEQIENSKPALHEEPIIQDETMIEMEQEVAIEEPIPIEEAIGKELEEDVPVEKENPEQTNIETTLPAGMSFYIQNEILQHEEKTDWEASKKKHKNKQIVKNLVLLLIVGAAVSGIAFIVPDVKQYAETFFFNNQGEEPHTTELVDEGLNINPDIKISVLEVEGADGYEVSYSTDKSFDEKTTVIVEVETADKAVESLSAGKTYYVRVRAFKFNEDGVKVYGEYTDVQKIDT